jgi:ParB-like chromosome segregation protein Spo0J
MPFELTTLPLAQLSPAEYNPRSVTAGAFRKLKASLARFGLVEPLVWNRRSGHVVGGHLRLRACQELGFETVPVSVVDLDAAAEKALNVVLNNHEAQGRYDPAKLATLLGELQGLDCLADTGFDARVLKTLVLDAVPALDPVPETGRVTVTLDVAAEVYEAMGPRLDALVADYDVVAHVQRS